MKQNRLASVGGRTRVMVFLVIVLLLTGVLAYIANRIQDGGGDVTTNETPEPSEEGSGIRLVRADTGISSAGAGGDGAGRLQVRLSKGQAQAQDPEPLPLVNGTPLSEDEIAQIVQRLPSLLLEPEDVDDFRLPEELLPPPRTGETIDEPFPTAEELAPPTVNEETAGGPLEVLRFAPEGQIPLAPFLNVTFNQPMVALDTVEALTAEEVPVRLTPQLPGMWRWLGTKTLTFEYQGETFDRFPMATEYVAEILAGTTSATGGVLAETITWKFSTPPPTMTSHYPNQGPQPLNPIFFIAFDQQIDPNAVLSTITVQANGQTIPLQLATEEEIAADETVSHMVEGAGDGRWLAFRPQSALPENTEINVAVGPGTPSAEGPLVTGEAQTFRFRTYSALRIEEHRCGWSREECPPYAPFFIRFNNPLDVEAFTESMVRIEPELPGAIVNVMHNSIEIRGATKARTDYNVTISGSTKDLFNQTLGDDETLTFEVGAAPRRLIGPPQPFVTLDPSSNKPVFSVHTINYTELQVRAYAVEPSPSDWAAFHNYLQNYYRDTNRPTPPGREVLNTTVRVEAASDALSEVPIDLSEALEGEFGHLIVIIEPSRNIIDRLRDHELEVVQAWVQVTQIGLDAVVDHSELVAWTTSLQDGTPLSGVTVSLEPASVESTTGDDGIARLDLPASEGAVLVATRGDDTAILTREPYYYAESGWTRQTTTDRLRWYVFDDRQMYRPGEDIHVKGWLRRVGATQTGDVGLLDGSVNSVQYTVTDSQGNELLTGEAEVNGLGGFDLNFTLPENANLGYASLNFQASGWSTNYGDNAYHHSFQIQEFRRPEFEVTTRKETEGPYFVSENATVAVSANYYAGGALPNADVTWNVTTSPSTYSPPNWPDFTFGKWEPWWIYGGEPGHGRAFSPFGGPAGPYDVGVTKTFSGVTDASGSHYLQIDFEAMEEPEPTTVVAQATVMDVNRQAWSSATNLLVHPSNLYVGLRSERTFVGLGEPLEIEAIVTDVDGNAVAGRTIEMRAARLEWRYSNGVWGEEEVDVQTCTVQSAAEPVLCSFETAQGGSYRIAATVTDDQGRANLSQFTRWVSGGERPPARNVEQEELTLIPNKETYEPGDVAEILLQAPFSPAEGLLTVTRNGILRTEQFQITEGSYTLRVPVEEGHVPGLGVQVELVGAAPRTDDAGNPLPDAPPRPAYAVGSLQINVSLRTRTLDVAVTPRAAELEPGGETVIDVTVTDHNGAPVPGAELAVVVVDEAILALSNYQLADPLTAFYENYPYHVESVYGRSTGVLARPESLLEQAGADDAARQSLANDGARVVTEELAVMPAATEAYGEADMGMAGGAASQPGQQLPPIRVRTNFDPLALFVPTVHTDEQGRAEVSVQLPDNLTRYRVMVVAVAGEKQFGTGEANVTARLPLMVRPSAPRFLNFGDRFELPVVLQNQTDEELAVDVVLQTGNLELTGGEGLRVTVPANDRVEVRFPAMTASVGTARLQIAGVAGNYADAATIELPVYTPATTEAFATYGVIDEGAILQPVASPENVFPQFGNLEISTSSTALQTLTDAVLYLVDYPYECSEQMASRILAIAALRDVLTAFSAEGLPAPAALEAAVQRDIEGLQALQNGDGGFAMWTRGKESIPFYSVHAAHALQRARTMGFDVPQEALQLSLEYMRNIESYIPSWYSEEMRWGLKAYTLYVRQLAGDRDASGAAKLLDEAGLENLPLEAVAWIWHVLGNDPAFSEQSAAIHRHLQNRAVETANAANFTTSYGDEAYLMLHSDRRTDGIILEALIANQPDSDLIPKVVNGLLAHRTKGRWSNTQENVFILLALNNYFNTFEAQTPDFVARIWLGETYAGSHTYEGRTTERHVTEIPMSYLMNGELGEEAQQDLVLSKDGTGRLYYRLGLSYAPSDLTLDPLDMGFAVERTYEALDNPDDVYQDEEGRWHIKAGARVRVKLTMATSNRRYHVALVDPLPAGLEIVNPDLAVSGDVPQDPSDPIVPYGWWWWGTWYEHQNMRDERAEAFASLVWDGVYTYTYVARATTPGEFVVPPAKAEEMYSPEVFGRSGSDWVIVE